MDLNDETNDKLDLKYSKMEDIVKHMIGGLIASGSKYPVKDAISYSSQIVSELEYLKLQELGKLKYNND